MTEPEAYDVHTHWNAESNAWEYVLTTTDTQITDGYEHINVLLGWRKYRITPYASTIPSKNSTP